MQIDRPITIAVLIFVIIMLVSFLVMPEYNIFKDLQTQLAGKTAEYNAQHAYYVEIAKMHNTLVGRQDDIKKIDNALPQDPALSKLVYYLQDAAKKNGLILNNLFLSKSSISNSVSGSVGVVKEIIFSADLLGDYASLERFITFLEKSSRIFEITNISFGATVNSSSGSSSSQQSFSLQIKTYSY